MPFVFQLVVVNMVSTLAKLTGAEFDAMAANGAFDVLGPKKIELIHGELRFMNPAGPVHDDIIDYLTRWSTQSADASVATIRVQCSFVCQENRPEPDILWLKPRRYRKSPPTPSDTLLLIEVPDSSLAADLIEKAQLYAQAGVIEYWIVDVKNQRLHCLRDGDRENYRSITVFTPPQCPSPLCLPAATLDLQQLFFGD